jgi:hypothetical protein
MTGDAMIEIKNPSEILSINWNYPISFIFSMFYLSFT